MTEREGVTKFQLDYCAAPALEPAAVAGLNAWRTVLWRLGLIGQQPGRYDGLGYGNVSARLTPFTGNVGARRFVISGTQTGGPEMLHAGQYTVVDAYDIRANRVSVQGPVAPSSESLTHGMIYDLDERARCVFHVHSPEIWTAAERLGLPCTDPVAAYGTPAMAEEIRRLFEQGDLHARGIFSMGGHQDGVVAFGATADEAGAHLVTALAQALKIET
ncbi:MAG TPA: class II aldolase/adducin family protein [Gammaproteobacteria bacterium]